MDEKNGVVITIKEIYQEQKKTNAQLGDISSRVGGVETRLNRLETQQDKRDKQQDLREQQQVQFTQKVKVTVLAALIPVALSVIFFVAKSGGM